MFCISSSPLGGLYRGREGSRASATGGFWVTAARDRVSRRRLRGLGVVSDFVSAAFVSASAWVDAFDDARCSATVRARLQLTRNATKGSSDGSRIMRQSNPERISGVRRLLWYWRLRSRCYWLPRNEVFTRGANKGGSTVKSTLCCFQVEPVLQFVRQKNNDRVKVLADRPSLTSGISSFAGWLIVCYLVQSQISLLSRSKTPKSPTHRVCLHTENRAQAVYPLGIRPQFASALRLDVLIYIL